MSEQTVAWMRANGNTVQEAWSATGEWRGYREFTTFGSVLHEKLPDDCVPLTQESKVEAANATRDEWESNYERVAAELAEAKAENTALSTTLAGYQQRARSAPSSPAVDVNDPDQAKFVADWVGGLTTSRLRIDHDDRFNLFGFWEKLKEYSIRIRLEQAEKAKRDQVIEDITANFRDRWGQCGVGMSLALRDSLDGFDITPKQVES